MGDLLSADDRWAIADLLNRYAWALADRDWDAYGTCFTPDATVDYSTAGGPVGSPAEARAWLEPTFGGFDMALSHTGNLVIDPVSAEEAKVRSLYRMTMRIAGEPPTYIEASGGYDDTVVRTPDGWRISSRHEDLRWMK
jgi:3-phenylpropionate/cinnamic acid dioxygenase small subunit